MTDPRENAAGTSLRRFGRAFALLGAFAFAAWCYAPTLRAFFALDDYAFLAANHQGNNALAGHIGHRSAGGDVLAVAQDRQPVGDGENLGELMTDKDDRYAVVA